MEASGLNGCVKKHSGQEKALAWTRVILVKTEKWMTLGDVLEVKTKNFLVN